MRTQTRFAVAALSLVVVSLWSTPQASSAVIFADYVILNTGSGNVFYDLGASTSNPNFSGANLGTFNPGAGDTLTLAGFQINTNQQSGDDMVSATGSYRIYPNATTPPGYTRVNVPFQSLEDFGGGNINKRWETTTLGTNLLANLSNGTYTFNIFTESHGNFNNQGGSGEFDIFSGSAQNPYTATFTVVPEPSTWVASILCLSAICFAQRRKLRALITPTA